MSVDFKGLEEYEVQFAINKYASEKDAAKRRAWEQRKQYEASLRRQGYDEEYIKRH